MKNMKKIGTVFMAGALALSMATGAFAKSNEKELSVEVSTLVSVTEVGVPVEVQAVTQKKGSGYDVVWSANNIDETVTVVKGTDFELAEGSTNLVQQEVVNLDSEGEEYIELVDHYISSTTFTGFTPGDYIVTATVSMWAGKSHVSWTGSDSTDIEVEVPAVFEGLSYKIDSVSQNGNSNNFTVEYTVFANYSNGSKETVTSASEVFQKNAMTKDVKVTYEGVTYTLTLNR